MEFFQRSHLLGLHRQRSGVARDVAQGLLLDRNERVVAYDEATLTLLAQHLAQVPLHRYPEMGPFYQKLATWTGVTADSLYVTEGVTGGLKAVCEALLEPGDNVVFPAPSFAMYAVYAQMFNVTPRTVGFTGDYQFDLAELYRQVDHQTKLVFLPNPHVPLESILEIAEIKRLARHCREHGAFLVLDEVYYLLGGPTGLGLLNECDNLLVMRSFSKAFGLASIRLGFIAGHPSVILYLSKMRAGSESNGLSLKAAEFFMDRMDIVESYIQETKSGLQYLKEELRTLGIEHVGGVAGNFVFVNLKDAKRVTAVVAQLAQDKIYVRGGWAAPYDAGFTITGGPRFVMERLMGPLREALRACR